MNKAKLLFSVLLLASAVVCAQTNPTLSQKQPEQRDLVSQYKVLIVPFEPKLYNSEIDRFVNAETSLSAKQIRYKFRDGLNEQIYKAYRAAKFNATDMMEDTAKVRKDLDLIYQYISYEYLPVPDQQKYQVPKKEKAEKKIEKGQLIVETKAEERFMDARLTSQKVLPVLRSKYKANLFLFINQLDIKASGNKGPTELGEGNPNRKIVVHYTLLNSDGTEINSGTVEEEFDPALNIPKKIADKHFSRVATTLVSRTQKAVFPKK